MTTELIESFQYPDECTERLCKDSAQRIRDLTCFGLKVALETRIEIGRELLSVERILPQGQLGPWLEYSFPLWNKESLRRCRVLAQRVDVHYVDSPKFVENLHKFEHITAAEEWAALPEKAQARVVEVGAFTRAAFQAVVWRLDAEDCLANDQMEYEHRYGVVLHDIDKVLHNDTAPEPLKEAAAELYQEHESVFARLADREPAELAVETGIEWKDPDTDKPYVQVTPERGRFAIFERKDGEWQFYAHILEYPEMVIDGKRCLLPPLPETNDGPAAASWSRAFFKAGCERLNASTLESRYGKAL